MTDRLDTNLAALERRLQRASSPTGSSVLRRRVLSAIDGVLREDPSASRSRSPRHPVGPMFPDTLAGTAFLSALATAVAVVALSAAAVPKPAMPLSLDARARIAGVNAESLGPRVVEHRSVGPALRSTRTHEPFAHPGMLRVLDGHDLLQETL